MQLQDWEDGVVLPFAYHGLRNCSYRYGKWLLSQCFVLSTETAAGSGLWKVEIPMLTVSGQSSFPWSFLLTAATAVSCEEKCKGFSGNLLSTRFVLITYSEIQLSFKAWCLVSMCSYHSITVITYITQLQIIKLHAIYLYGQCSVPIMTSSCCSSSVTVEWKLIIHRYVFRGMNLFVGRTNALYRMS